MGTPRVRRTSVHDRLGLGPLGIWCSIPSSYTAEIVASCGVDWVCLDLQHGFLAPADVLPMVQAAALAGTKSLVRVGNGDVAAMGRALDAGAVGVVVPMINTAAEAERAIEACRYAPEGSRSWGPARLVLRDPEYRASGANEQVLCLPMIETMVAVRNIHEILSVNGVRAVLVGTSDLAVDLGKTPRPGPVDDEHLAAMTLVADACRRHGVVAGTNCGSREAAHDFAAVGYELFALASDANLLKAASHQLVDQVRHDQSQALVAQAAAPPRPNGASK